MNSGDLGDHIGMESCVDLETETASALSSGGGGSAENQKRSEIINRSSISAKKPKELPPPLPIHKSTVMKRHYTDDGRLVITEEKIESPKFRFTAHRSHGRLTLQLVCSDSSSDSEDDSRSSEIGEEDEIVEDVEEEEEECSEKVAVGGDDGDGGSRGGGMCFSYNAAVVRAAATGSCLLVNQNELHSMRPVQI